MPDVKCPRYFAGTVDDESSLCGSVRGQSAAATASLMCGFWRLVMRMAIGHAFMIKLE